MNPHEWSEEAPAAPRLISSRPAVVAAVAAVLTDASAPSTTSTSEVGAGSPGGTPFHALDPPQISIAAYVRRVAKYTYCSNAALLSALLYMERAAASSPLFAPSLLSTHRLFLAAVVVAAKFHDDTSYNLEYYGKVGGLPVSELAALEVALLRAVDFRLNVSTTAFVALEARALAMAVSAPSPLGPEAASASNAAGLVLTQASAKVISSTAASPLFSYRALASRKCAVPASSPTPSAVSSAAAVAATAARLSRCTSYVSCASPQPARSTPGGSPATTVSAAATPWDSPVSNPDTSSNGVVANGVVAVTSAVPPPAYPSRIPPAFVSHPHSFLFHSQTFPHHIYPHPHFHPHVAPLPTASASNPHVQVATARRAAETAAAFPSFAQPHPRQSRMRMW